MPADPVTNSWPTVSIVVINYNGRDYLDACLGSLADLDYPADAVEIIFIDNNSSDGSPEYVEQTFPAIRVERNSTNTGFSPAVNQGARLANGTYLALLNNDATADPDWIRSAVRVLESSASAATVASKILRDDRTTVDYAGGQMAFYAHGFAARNKEVDDPQDTRSRHTLFASGGAMITRRDLFVATGGFDETFFAFFEDVDYGWRMWVLGHETIYLPQSVVYHRHHGTIQRFGYPRERYLLERNALKTAMKNYGDELLARTLPGMITLSLLRGLADDPDQLPDFRISEDVTPVETVELSPLTASHLAAIRDWGLDLSDTFAKRAEIQRQRTRDDAEIVRLFEEPLLPNHPDADFLSVFNHVVSGWQLDQAFRGRSRVLIITADHLGTRMAGPAIRCWEMAKLLSAEHHVVLGTTRATSLTHPDFTVTEVDSKRIDALLEETDVVIFQGFIMHFYPQIASADVAVLVDIYDPFHLEGLELRREEAPLERFSTARSDVQVLNQQLERGDFFVCASDKQRDFWLGQLASIGRVNPATYDQDPSLRQLLDVAPFGLPNEPPVKRESAIRKVVDGIDDDDFVLLWGGGIYNWFDPLSLIRAIGDVAGELPDIKLFFLGSAHPNPDVPKMKMAASAYQLAERSGLLDTHVFFNPGWVEYERRADYLLESNVGVSTHFEHIETAFSFRTRILDYLWAGLPILATQGDSLSRLVHEHGLGVTVPPEDPGALADALRRLRGDPDFYAACAANVEAFAPQMTWEESLAPVTEFVRHPRHAVDRSARQAATMIAEPADGNRPVDLVRKFTALRSQVGNAEAVRQTGAYVRRRLAR